MLPAPEVSVIIPTLHRPRLLARALRSVFAQSFRNFEVIVVVDGPDPETLALLAAMADSRIEIIANPRSLTAAGARNAGVRRARGMFVALLDDDDEWLPHKLGRQIEVARSNPAALIACRSRILRGGGQDVWPQVIYDNGQPFDEYLFDRRGAFAGASFIQTSSLLIPRQFYASCPFSETSPHDDWEFVLRASKEFGMRVLTLPDVLVQVHEQEVSLSGKSNWWATLCWADSLRPILSPRGYSGICLGVAGPRAAKARAYWALPLLIFKSFRHGSPRATHVAAFAAFWLMPQATRRRLRSWITRRRPAVCELRA